MNRHHFTQIANLLGTVPNFAYHYAASAIRSTAAKIGPGTLRVRLWYPFAAAIALAGLALFAGGLLWLKPGTDREPLGVRARLADAPSREAASPEHANSQPQHPEASQLMPNVSLIAAPVIAPGPAATPPAVETGPQLFTSPASAAVVKPVEDASASRGPAGRQTERASAATAAPLVPYVPPVAAPIGPPAAASPVPSVLPPQVVRSEAMETIARQADEKVRQGMELADRGACFAARAEFIAALRLLAQGLDNDSATSRHGQSLSAALTAMREAQDFLPANGKIEAELDLAAIVAGHRTPLLKKAPPERLQAMRAVKQYFTFAQEQLCQAVDCEVSGSMALGALGKLHAAMAEKANPDTLLPEAKAITFFQAALLVCPRNFIAANDLGVLLAHKNEYAAACAALEHSVTVCRCAENLKNLSTVYKRLGNFRLAELAARDSESAKAAELARQKNNSLSAGGAVQWVGPDALAKASGQWSDGPVRPAAPTAGQASATGGIVAGQPATPFSPPVIR